MRISHRELAQFQRNPAEWISKKDNPTANFRRQGYNQCLREGIYFFHRHENDKMAREYIQDRIIKLGLKNEPRIQKTLRYYDTYIDWFQSRKITTARSRVTLNFDIGNGLILGGIICRIDMIPQGYRAILLQEIPLQWEEELRMPLIQRGIARTFYRPEEDFKVGFQELDTSNLVDNSYSKKEIDNAQMIVKQLAEEVISESENIDKFGTLFS